MVIGIVILELMVSLFLAIMIGAGSGGDMLIAPLNIWLALAVLRLTIHYMPRHRYTKCGTAFLLIILIVIGTLPGHFEIISYPHQSLLIASLAVLPQFWREWFAKGAKGRLFPRLIETLALPLSMLAWIFGNIWIVKAQASIASNGATNCLFVSNGGLPSSGYHEASNDLSLSGWNMFSNRGGGGSGDCCQWDFHALLKTHDNQLFNWSYKSQQFEHISERTAALMHLSNLTCPAS